MTFRVILLLLAAGFSWADDSRKTLDQYVHTVWTSEQGLPQNSVQTILQTRDGYLWMGTEEGLVRFDGVRFAVFNKTNTPAIKHNDVWDLIQDRDGALWMGTLGGGVTRYFRGQFRSYTVKDGLSNNFVNAILQDKNSTVWLGTDDGLDALRSGTFTHYGKEQGLSGSAITALAEDASGDLWVGTNRGLNRIRAGTITTAPLPAKPVIKALYRDPTGEVWIGTEGAGLFRLSPAGLVQYGSRQGLPRAPVLSILKDRSGVLWIGTGAGGICRLYDTGRFGCYTSKNGLSGDTVLSLYQGREGNIWAGTEAGGLNEFRDGDLTTYGAAQGLSGAVRFPLSGRRWNSLGRDRCRLKAIRRRPGQDLLDTLWPCQ